MMVLKAREMITPILRLHFYDLRVRTGGGLFANNRTANSVPLEH